MPTPFQGASFVRTSKKLVDLGVRKLVRAEDGHQLACLRGLIAVVGLPFLVKFGLRGVLGVCDRGIGRAGGPHPVAVRTASERTLHFDCAQVQLG